MLFDNISSSVLKPFKDYISVRGAKEIGFIPESHYDMFDDECFCGSERMVRIQKGTRSVTAITCVDPGCPLKMKYQVCEVFDRFGYKGIGPETCGKVVNDVLNQKGSVCLYDVLVDGMKYSNLTGASELEFSSALKLIEESQISFGKFVANLSYPFIGRKFEDVLRGVSDFSDFVEIASSEGGIVPFFANRGVKSVDTIFHFIYFAKEIERISEYFRDSISASSRQILPICMTGHMETSHKKYSKDEYLYQCNLLALNEDGSGKSFDIVSVESVSKASFVIIGADSVSRKTTKYRNAVTREQSLRDSNYLGPEEKLCFGPEEFLMYLLKGDESDE